MTCSGVHFALVVDRRNHSASAAAARQTGTTRCPAMQTAVRIGATNNAAYSVLPKGARWLEAMPA
jgi:hypothetical protein